MLFLYNTEYTYRIYKKIVYNFIFIFIFYNKSLVNIDL